MEVADKSGHGSGRQGALRELGRFVSLMTIMIEGEWQIGTGKWQRRGSGRKGRGNGREGGVAD